jgi:DnaK suppressor protein
VLDLHRTHERRETAAASPQDSLTAELRRLTHELEQLAEQPLDRCPADLAEQADRDRQRREREERRDAVRGRLEQVVAALDRLEEGTYGRCEHCGRRIRSERLAVLPLTVRCARHAAA